MRIWRNKENFLYCFTFPSLYQAPEAYMGSKQTFPEDYLHLLAYDRYTLTTLHSSQIMTEVLIC